ncbi:MAG: TCP-1/cpn60 chaperonin family protein [Candidatus Nitrosopolaris sp.]
MRGWSSNLEGRAQLTVQKFADALDSIPLSLAENAGMDPIDTMTELREKQNKGVKWTGVDVRNTKVTDMFKQDVLEPLVVKSYVTDCITPICKMSVILLP